MERKPTSLTIGEIEDLIHRKGLDPEAPDLTILPDGRVLIERRPVEDGMEEEPVFGGGTPRQRGRLVDIQAPKGY